MEPEEGHPRGVTCTLSIRRNSLCSKVARCYTKRRKQNGNGHNIADWGDPLVMKSRAQKKKYFLSINDEPNSEEPIVVKEILESMTDFHKI